MSATAEKIETKAVRQVSVNGYIDAITNNRIYGWAWDAQKPDARITVRLQAGGHTVGIVAADLLREDLKANGIGDGAHAFETALPEGVSPNDISLIAVCPDTGQTVELAPRAVARQPSAGGQDLRTAVETLAKSHGFIHRKLQTMAAAMAESRRNGAPKPDVAPTADTSSVAMPRVQSLEEAVMRFDGLLKRQEEKIEALRSRPVDPMPRLLAAGAIVLSVAALLIALVK
jgi:hypothetical protein